VLFGELMFLVAGRFGPVGPPRTAREFERGLLPPAERKDCWWPTGKLSAGERWPAGR
jgi:hypothetical protein